MHIRVERSTAQSLGPFGKSYGLLMSSDEKATMLLRLTAIMLHLAEDTQPSGPAAEYCFIVERTGFNVHGTKILHCCDAVASLQVHMDCLLIPTCFFAPNAIVIALPMHSSSINFCRAVHTVISHWKHSVCATNSAVVCLFGANESV